MDRIAALKKRAYELRVLSLQATTEAGSGHPTSCLSAADMVAALFFDGMTFDPAHPDAQTNDRFILSKGHAAPVLYAAWKEMGVLTFEQLMTLRKFDSVLEGHPTTRFEYNEAATGSLGCGLSIGLGMALSSRIQKVPFRTYVLLGDSEMSEGSVWEAIMLAAYYGTSNLTALVDMNRLGQTTQTIDAHDTKRHAERWKAFGWHTMEVDGHAMQQIVDALDQAKLETTKPTVIIARTIKGFGLEDIQDKIGYHGKALSKEQLEQALHELRKKFAPDIAGASITSLPAVPPYVPPNRKPVNFSCPQAPYTFGSERATRKAFGDALATFGGHEERIISLDAEVMNSTFAQTFEQQYRDRFIQCFIAEQNMIGMAVGLYSRGLVPVCSTFASFLSRAHDQIRMAAIDRAALRLVGSHAGVSIGQDGPSQMGLEDIALMRAVPESVVLYPCDAVSAHALLYRMLTYETGCSYLRTTRADTPVIYRADTVFTIGGSHVLRSSDDDQICIFAAGITVYEALKAHERLAQKGIAVRVIDLYSIKPLDIQQILKAAKACHNRIITVEDHYLQGGMGEAVCYALKDMPAAITVLAVHELSRSGMPHELLAYHKIDADAIVASVVAMLG